MGRDRKALEGVVLSLDSIAQHLVDARELFELAKSEDDEETLISVEGDLAGLEKEVGSLEFRRMFNNPLDPNACFLEIQAGAGGTEAQDWAAMLLRMYPNTLSAKGLRLKSSKNLRGISRVLKVQP